LQEALQAGAQRESIRRLVSAWILHCPNNSESSLLQRLRVAATQQFAEAVPMAVDVATREGTYRNTPVGPRVVALLYVGQFGNRENVERLEPLLEDASLCVPAVLIARRTGPGPGVDVQIRDVALIVLLQLTDQRAGDYGYPHAQRPTTQDMDVTLMYPRSAEERRVAIGKWRRWKAAQRRPPLENGESQGTAPAAAGRDRPE
jgi:hypothetical protein